MNDNSNRFSMFTLALFWLFAFFVIIFMITFTSHASSNEEVSYVIPYNMYTFINNNTYCYNNNDAIIEAAINWNSDIANYNWDNYIAFPIEDAWNNYGEVQIIYLFNPSISYDVPIDFNFFSNPIIITYDNSVTFNVLFNSPIQPFEFSSWGSGNGGTYSVCGGFIPSDKGDGSVQRFYPFALSDTLYDSNNDVIFAWIDSPSIQTGHATPPGEFSNPVVPSGHTLPHEVPTAPTINNYSWTIYNPPAFVNTDVLSALESIRDSITYSFNWLYSNLSGEFTNLIDNIGDYFDYLVQTLQYYLGLIIDNIQNAINTFYNNMVSLLEPIFELFAYITEPIDSSAISTAFNNTSFVGIKSQFTTFFTTFESAFDISEPNTFTLTINIQNIDTFFNFGCRSPVIIHLDEHFTPIKTALRTFLWILISFGSVFVVEHGLSDWLRGENDTK